jgi:hypothetical protein
MNEWQPIETAPEGSYVEFLVVDKYGERFVAFRSKSGEWKWSPHDDGWCKPTHWMPLPAPPKVKP